jgi:hypothetical protein
VNGAQLILGDAIRPPEIVGLRNRARIFRRGPLSETAEYTINLFLRKYPIRSHSILLRSQSSLP